MQINTLLKYYEYHLTKRCLEGRLEGFKDSSWLLKIITVVDGCMIIIHQAVTCDST